MPAVSPKNVYAVPTRRRMGFIWHFEGTAWKTRTFAVAFGVVLSSSCGDAESACELGRRKVDTCARESSGLFGGTAQASSVLRRHQRLAPLWADECDSDGECVASCLNGHACADINALWGAAASSDPNGGSPSSAGALAFGECLSACEQARGM